MADDGITPQAAPPRFDTEPYRVTGPAPVGGVLLLFTALPAAGAVIGLLVSVLAQWLYLVVLFPIGMGMLAGAAGWGLVRAGKARGPVVAGGAALLTAAVTMAGFHFGIYLQLLKVVDERTPGVRARELQQPVQGFVRFMDRQAQQGVTIGKPGAKGDKKAKPDDGINFGYVGSYAYWALEVGLVAVAVYEVLRAAAQRSLCDQCRRWKKEWQLAVLPGKPPDLVSGPLRDGQLLALLGEAGEAGAAGGEGLALKAAVCPACGASSSVDVTLERRTVNGKGQQEAKRLERVRYPGAVLAFLDGRVGPA